jgi:undecaprenyl-diphosphatase
MLENAVIVAWALIVGGIAILLVERFAKPGSGGVANLSTRQSILIGLVQCIAMIPGVSRSGATILGAMSLGVDRKTAAEFSFFLALPTLTGATVLQLFKHRDAITSNDLGLIAVGFVVSFIVALGGDQGVSGRRHALRLRALCLVSNHRRDRRADLAWHEIGPIRY